MIDKYYNGVIEQVYEKVGKVEKNIVMACYSNDFSIRDLENIRRYSAKEDNVFFAWHEYEYDALNGAYEPFLDTICNMHRKYIKESFSEFLSECGVYYLHRPVFESYYESGKCVREENVLLEEVSYEQQRMIEAMVTMLKRLAAIHPVVIVINRFQIAARSTLELVNALLEEPSSDIGLVLGANEVQFGQDNLSSVWNSIVEALTDNSQLYHIGSTGKRRAKYQEGMGNTGYEKRLELLSNMNALLDFEQAKQYFQMIEHSIKFEDANIPDETKLEMYLMYARTSILLGELSKALELVEEVMGLTLSEQKYMLRYECSYLAATCYMYQGKLEEALDYAKMAREEAVRHGNEEKVFKAELLMAQTKMSGWYNIFFCTQEVPIEESLIDKLIKYNYKNHLAHIYIYAYDNSPEVVAKAHQSEELLTHFRKGVALAKEIGNRHLIYNAYQKNIMIASTDGMNEIAMRYNLQSYQFMNHWEPLYDGRVYTSLGYSLSAMGYNQKAEVYYNLALEVFYDMHMTADIAEVYYNQALNHIMQEKFEEAEHELQMVMKVIEKLHLNSLRVCNISKLYALLALTYILQKDRFNCERYLLSCSQFLNYIIERERNKKNVEIIHDFAKCDDDMFLYTFATALLNRLENDEETACINFEKAEKFLLSAEGNQFFCYGLYRKSRMDIYEKLGMTDLHEKEKYLLEQHEEAIRQRVQGIPWELLEEVDKEFGTEIRRVPDADIEVLIKHHSLLRDYQSSKRQMDFIPTWQKLIDVSGADIDSMVGNAMRAFLNHFNTDQALYIRYEDQKPKVLYNDTGVKMTPEVLEGLERAMGDYPQGFAVSKVSDNFLEHLNIISYFGEHNVYSFAAVPFFKKGSLTSLLITYVFMKDNWHTSLERYMLDEDDLRVYQMLFREMSYSINRMEASQKVYEMNRKLQEAAVTDMLTGIYNRAGMYEEIHRITERIKNQEMEQSAGLMFIDLDNFKPYNDTYGHDIGDIILKEMARIFKEVAGNDGFVSRYGGDEFIIIFNTGDVDKLEEFAKEIYRRIEAADGFRKEIEQRLHQEVSIDEKHRITCSIGIAFTSQVRDDESIDQLIRKADDLLYSVKTGEKGHYAFI